MSAAEPFLWTLNGVTFDDGGAATGSFIFDADTNTYSAINITTTAGTVLGGATYGDVNPCCTLNAFQLITVPDASLPDLTGAFVFFPAFAPLLTNLGGTVGLFPSLAEALCIDAGCNGPAHSWRPIMTGEVIGTAVSVAEPGTLGLLGLGLAGIGLTRRRKTA